MKVYTTGEVSRICKVAISTVNKWFDSGRLKGFRVPGSRHRRIPRANLVTFLKQYGLPLQDSPLEAGPWTALVVARDPQLIRNLSKSLSAQGEFSVLVASSSFEVGITAEETTPDCIIIDLSVGLDAARQIGRKLRGRAGLQDPVLVAIVGRSDNLRPWLRGQVDEIFQQPFDPQLLARRVRTLVTARQDGSRPAGPT